MMHPHSPLPARPRVKAGVPLGGVAAMLVLAGTVGWSLLAGNPPSSHGRTMSLSAGDGSGITVRIKQQVQERVAERMEEKRERRGLAPQNSDSAAVDIAAINRSVASSIEAAAKLATAKAESMRGRRDGDINYLDRNTAADGSNRLAATAEAPGGVRLADVVGTVRIKVVDNADAVLFSMENSRKRYNLSINDGVLWITGPGPQSQPAVTLDIAIPRGTPLLVNRFTGDLSVDGDLGAPARLELANGEMKLGDMDSVRVRITQSGTVTMGNVKGLAGVELPGTGTVTMGAVGTAALSVNSQGMVNLGAVTDGLAISMAGPGVVDIGTMAGDLSAAIPGPGTLNIAGGRANSLAVGVTGPGTVDFNGTAKDPRILVAGPGRVSLAGHEGTPKVFHVGPGRVDLSR